MMRHLLRRVLGFAVGSTVVLGLASVAPAAAAAFSQTTHFNSIVDQSGTPPQPPPVTNNSNCPSWVLNDYVLINATGNGVQHYNQNGAGDNWFTTTFTGTATIAFFPTSDLSGSPDATVTGHLQEWFGAESNRSNQVVHGTVNFQGSVVGGGPISFHNNAQFVWTPGMDPNGPPKFYVNNASC